MSVTYRSLIKSILSISLLIISTPDARSTVLKDEHSLDTIREVLQQIKNDPDNASYRNMLEDVRAEHSIKYHKPNAPFFYSNDRYVIKDIIDLVIDEPDGIIDHSQKSGTVMIYRNNNYHHEIEELFDREPLYKRDIPQPKVFQRNYLGLTITGPTNAVMIVLKIKGDEQFASSFKERVKYTGNNIIFKDAFPVKKGGSLPRPRPPMHRRNDHHRG